MGIFNFFRSRSEDNSAKVAKDRLQVLIAHERTGRNGPDYLPMLKQDILNVIKKYVSVGEDQVSVQLDTQENCDVLELNITLPEDAEAKSGPLGGKSGGQSSGKSSGQSSGKSNGRKLASSAASASNSKDLLNDEDDAISAQKPVRNAGSLSPPAGSKNSGSGKKSRVT